MAPLLHQVPHGISRQQIDFDWRTRGPVIGDLQHGRPTQPPMGKQHGLNETLPSTSDVYRQRDPSQLLSQAQQLAGRSEEHTSELQSRGHLVCRLLLEKNKQVAATAAGSTGSTHLNTSDSRKTAQQPT